MSAGTRYGQPVSVKRDNNETQVTYEDGKVIPLRYLKRGDLIRTASAVTEIQGTPLKRTNEELRAMIKQAAPWERYSFSFGKRKDKSNDDGERRVTITGSCGHPYAYRIKRETAIEWLKTQPCPSCKFGKGKPTTQEGEPTPKEQETTTQDPDPDVLAAVAEALAGLHDVWHHDVTPYVLQAVKADVPVWLQGPPGTSKSTIGYQVSDILGAKCYPVACHQLMSRTDLFGYSDAQGNDHRTPLWDAYEYGGILLLDEVDNGNPNLLAALNGALSNGHAVFGSGTIVERHPNFRVIATANTNGLGPESGYVGRLGVDTATRDRFVTVPVPIDNKLEQALVERAAGQDADPVSKLLRKRLDDTTRTIALNITNAPDTSDVLKAVDKVRQAVESRSLVGVIVGPRTSIHVAKLTRAGWTLPEAFTATGLATVDPVMRDAILAELGGAS